jgi:hypothetical protein
MTTFCFFRQQFYGFELTRLLGGTATGGSETAEFLETLACIRLNDPEN